MSDENNQYNYTQNRELSWLKFNERVLEEAEDRSVPFLERLSFISIFISNLDEFFMVRVGRLLDLSVVNHNSIDKRSGMTPSEQLQEIYEEVKPLYKKKDRIYFDLEESLELYGIKSLSIEELTIDEKNYIKQYFDANILPILSPQIIDSHHPFPHIINKVINIATVLRNKGKKVFGLIPVPSALPEIVFLPGAEIKYIKVEKIILEFAHEVFDMYEIVEKNYMCITRNADITFDEDEEDETYDINEDFRYMMKKVLSKRDNLGVVRLEVGYQLSRKLEEFLCEKFDIKKKQIFCTKSPMKLGYIEMIKDKISRTLKNELLYPKFTPRRLNNLITGKSIAEQAENQDLFLSYPFYSMQPFLTMVKEASDDSSVVSIKICIYRLAKRARLVEYLCRAAKNGKDVTVVIELRARFDEQNNINWSEKLEEAGCRVIYGFEGFKVHSKVCLVTRRENDTIKYLTHISTGNFNEKTAAFYTDLSIITANKMIGIDAMNFFKNMAIGNLNGSYNLLLVSPFCLKNRVILMIRKESEKKARGRIVIKLNSITDIDIIHELSKASCAGVKIDLIVRGICCIVPGIKGYTENIRVISIVGRFLEHSRIYSFGTGDEQKLYISSADFMTRNTEKRVEVACPILEKDIKEKINAIINIMLNDNVKSRQLISDGAYIKRPSVGMLIDSQEVFMKQSKYNSNLLEILNKQEEIG